MSVKYTIETVIRDVDTIQKRVAEGSIEDMDTQLNYIKDSLRWFLEGREYQPGIQVWYFDTTEDAYDACMSRECFDDGDAIVILKEGVVGVATSAWPTAVTKEAGALHQMKTGFHLNTIEEGKYCRHYELACAIAARNNLAIA